MARLRKVVEARRNGTLAVPGTAHPIGLRLTAKIIAHYVAALESDEAVAVVLRALPAVITDADAAARNANAPGASAAILFMLWELSAFAAIFARNPRFVGEYAKITAASGRLSETATNFAPVALDWQELA
ncbi:MAG: hypothetical protein KGL39_01435 [Patescibacteria group bacterium]|nr:hypothetical protein [Patescibacteria group bacterium]